MVKLYKKNGNETLYWEAWEHHDGSLIIHSGVLGTDGELEQITLSDDEEIAAVIQEESKLPMAEGYAEIQPEDHSHLILQYRQRGDWAGDAALDKRVALVDMLDQCLGWTGNGHCDGSETGTGTLNFFMFTVEPHIAKKTLFECLKQEKLLDGAILAQQTGDDGYKVLWPDGHKGEFSIV